MNNGPSGYSHSASNSTSSSSQSGQNGHSNHQDQRQSQQTGQNSIHIEDLSEDLSQILASVFNILKVCVQSTSSSTMAQTSVALSSKSPVITSCPNSPSTVLTNEDQSTFVIELIGKCIGVIEILAGQSQHYKPSANMNDKLSQVSTSQLR